MSSAEVSLHHSTHQLVPSGLDALVDFDGVGDPLNPQNWSFSKKVRITGLWALTTCWITLASAIYAAGTQQISQEFEVTEEVANAGTSLLVFGFAIGPMLWAPLCELYGRKWPSLIPYFISAAFAFGTGAAKDIQTVLITRFFAGVLGSAPISVTGGAIVDIWAPKQRGTPIVCYGVTLAAAPTVGPVIGGGLVAASQHSGWRWTQYLTGILMMIQFFVDALFLDESQPDVLLTRKAQRLRHETGNFALHSKREESGPSINDLVNTYLVRPFQMLLDPICQLFTIYTSFVFAILYASLTSFAIEYQEDRMLGPVVGELPFLAMLVGCFFAAAANIYNNNYYTKRFVANNFKPVAEARLPPMMYGGFTFAGGLFLFGWTSSQHVSSPWPSIIGVFLTGFGFTTIFQAALQYLVDTFTLYSASAVAANTFVRSLAAGAFPLFVSSMYRKLGIDWGTTVFALFGVVLLPAPFLFFKWGFKIRARGRWSRLSTL
ncbi:MFS multidrug transporter-like protein [Rhizodiscina lignyota]|uniref:MFS multidrug transporter-like protein n=1 Tax=Rhizodiscina lignyota TaxID=1504668 RepID=A0A9P4I771_9PEZI|nr:MFS multidrug transporter-like protein [Rhizodiscina lignyota]